MLAFGIGQVAEGVKNQAFNVFVLFYYQQVIGIPGTLAGLALGVALVFDAVTDPIAGVVSDRFQSRFGRRHPFLLMSALPLALFFVGLFNPPDNMSDIGNFLWLTGFAIGVRAALTFYHVPHLALGAEMATDYAQRSTVFAFSTVFSISGMAAVGFIGYRYFFPTTDLFNPGTLNPDAYAGFSLFFALVMVIVIVTCCIGTASEIPHLAKPSARPFTLRSIRDDYSDVFQNRSFRTLFFGMVLGTLAIAIEAVLSPFMGVHFWGLPTERLAFLSVATLIGLWIGLPLAPLLTAWLDKRMALVLPAVVVVVNANIATILRLSDVPWFPDNDSPWIFWLLFAKLLIQGMCLPVIFATFNSMFADIADEVELERRRRHEGVIYATRAFAAKATAALGAFLGGVVLDWIAFPKSAAAGTVNADTLWLLGLMEGPVTSIVSICGVMLYLRYRIDRTRYATIRAAIDARTTPPTTDTHA